MKANQSRTKDKRNDDGEIGIRKQTLDKMLRHKHSADMIALYVFLNYTALWQRTSQPKATVGYIAKGLHWGVNKVRRIKKLLVQRGLIEDLCVTDPKSKRVTGWYVRVAYFHPNCFREGGDQESTLAVSPEVVKWEPNALRANKINALRPNNTHTKRPQGGLSVSEMADRIYEAYPKKEGTSEAKAAIRRALKNVDYETLLSATKRFARHVSCKEYRYIPRPKRWYDGGFYLDKRSLSLPGRTGPQEEEELEEAEREKAEIEDAERHPELPEFLRDCDRAGVEPTLASFKSWLKETGRENDE